MKISVFMVKLAFLCKKNLKIFFWGGGKLILFLFFMPVQNMRNSNSSGKVKIYNYTMSNQNILCLFLPLLIYLM